MATAIITIDAEFLIFSKRKFGLLCLGRYLGLKMSRKDKVKIITKQYILDQLADNEVDLSMNELNTVPIKELVSFIKLAGYGLYNKLLCESSHYYCQQTCELYNYVLTIALIRLRLPEVQSWTYLGIT